MPILTSAPSKQPAYFSFIESLWETDSLQSVPEIISWMWSTVVITTPTEIFQTIIIPSLEHWSDTYLIIFCHQLADGLLLEKTSCPLGVLLIVFESRPDALVQVKMIRIIICLRWWPEDNSSSLCWLLLSLMTYKIIFTNIVFHLISFIAQRFF